MPILNYILITVENQIFEIHMKALDSKLTN